MAGKAGPGGQVSGSGESKGSQRPTSEILGPIPRRPATRLMMVGADVTVRRGSLCPVGTARSTKLENAEDRREVPGGGPGKVGGGRPAGDPSSGIEKRPGAGSCF